MKLGLVSIVMCAAMAAATSSALSAQTKTLTGDAIEITATVEAIDAATRTLTVKGPKGAYVPITVPKSMAAFSQIKVGDSIKTRYYDNIVIRVKPAGEAAVNTYQEALTKGTGANPAATGAGQRTITAQIVAIDKTTPSITFKGEGVKWDYSSRVMDKDALAKVKVGDRVDITWTEAVTVALAPKP